jgi:hypothetical protein
MLWQARTLDDLLGNTDTCHQRFAYNYSIALKEMELLWQESIDRNDERIATAAAGSILVILYGSERGFLMTFRRPIRTDGCCSTHQLVVEDSTTTSSVPSKDSIDEFYQLDKQGSKTILLNQGLLDPRLVHQVYNEGDPARSKQRAGVTWGILHFATCVYVCQRSTGFDH